MFIVIGINLFFTFSFCILNFIVSFILLCKKIKQCRNKIKLNPKFNLGRKTNITNTNTVVAESVAYLENRNKTFQEN